MLDAVQPDVVSICTPDDTHPAMVRLVLSARSARGVLLEKPVALRASDALELAGLAAQASPLVAVNYTRRYAASHVAVKEVLDARGLGPVQCVSGYYTKGMLHNGTHWLDLARYFFGEIRDVAGFMGAGGPPGDPSFDVRLEFCSGLRGSLLACDSTAYSLFEMDIVGTSGRIRIVDSGLGVETSQAGPSAEFPGYEVLGVSTMRRSGFDDLALRAVEDLVAAIEAGRAPRCTLRDGVRAVEIAEAIARSAETGHPVRVEGG
jgi:predicted dehydrogenase